MAGIYVHIPFCKRRCIYCDFYSTVKNERRKDFVAALCMEIELRKNYLLEFPKVPYDDSLAKDTTIINTIYLGGGTPSQLEPKELKLIFDHLYKVYRIAPDAEITLEANPDDLTVNMINKLRSLPINRISIGVQTFSNKVLSLLQRRHTSEQACEAIRLCRACGYQNISIDLIYGLPGQTLEVWVKDIEQALALRPTHISAYSLTYEEGTAIWNMRKQALIKETNEEVCLQMFTYVMDKLRSAGFDHYEISNFCLPGFHSRHNSSYWNNEIYLGFGPSAHSYDGINRQWNIAHLEQYITSVLDLYNNKDSEVPLFEIEKSDLGTRYNEHIITSLRMSCGLDLYLLEQKFGTDLHQYCMKMAAPHLTNRTLKHTPSTKEFPQGKLILTRTGIFISNYVISDLIYLDD